MSEFSRTVREMVKFFLCNGYTSREKLERWQGIIRQAAESEIHNDYIPGVSDKLRSAYKIQINRTKALDRYPGLSRFTLSYMESKLRSEPGRRTLVSADLIKLSRTGAIDKTVQRFSGWVTSILMQDHVGSELSLSSKSGVSYNCDRIQKNALQVDFEVHRVVIDQNHKLIADVDNIITVSNNAIATKWHSRWWQADYDYREDHKERDRVIYLIHGNWTQKSGHAKVRPPSYFDEITQSGGGMFCRCYVTYLYSFRSTPECMLTRKGQKFMASIKSAQEY